MACLKGGRRGYLPGIYKALLHNPALAETWFDHLNAVRWETDLPGRLREILIIRVGYLLNCRYILRQHIPKLAAADGVTQSECDALTCADVGEVFSALERAAIAATDALTREATLPPALAGNLKAHFTDRQVVEVMVLVGTYNMHARFVNGVDLDLEPQA